MDNFLQHIFSHLRHNNLEDSIHEEAASRKSYTRRELYEAIGCMQSGLKHFGVTPQDRVVLIAPNSFLWVACDLAVMSMGAISVPMYHRQAPHEWADMIQDCHPKLIVVADNATRDALAPHTSGLCLTLESLLAHPFDGVQCDVALSEVLTLVYTSGTSGKAKGAMITGENLHFMLERILDRLSVVTQGLSDERVFHYLPTCFMGSRMMLLAQLCRGKEIYFSTDLSRLKDEIASVNPSYFLNVPAVLERIRSGVTETLAKRGGLLYQQYLGAQRAYFGQSVSLKDRLALRIAQQFIFPKIRQRLGSHLSFLICGSAPLRQETQGWFEMLGIRVYQVYGLTETTAIISMDVPFNVRVGNVGVPLDGVEVRVSPEGELWARGPNIFRGYWQKPQETEAAFHDGWFRTGDVAELSMGGHIRILGRLKNVLVLDSGHNVVAEPIEEALQSLIPASEHVVLVGHARPYLTALVTGPVTLQEVSSAIETLNETLPHYKRIKRFFIASQGLSHDNGLLTANQKIRRNEVDRAFSREIDRLYQGASKSL